jgi:hypothetical protein
MVTTGAAERGIGMCQNRKPKKRCHGSGIMSSMGVPSRCRQTLLMPASGIPTGSDNPYFGARWAAEGVDNDTLR